MKKKKPRLPTYQEIAAECWSIAMGLKSGRIKPEIAVERANIIGKLLSAAKQHIFDGMVHHRTHGQVSGLLGTGTVHSADASEMLAPNSEQ